MTEEDWVDPLARAGLGARAVVYLLLAWLVVEVALGRTRRSADEQGALGAVAVHPLGRVLVVAVAAGLAGLALWQVAIALHAGPGPWRRVVAGGKAVGYGALTAVAVGVALHPSRRGNEQEVTARLMVHLLGRLAVGGVGVAVAVGGAVLAAKGLARRYDVDVRPPRDEEGARAFEAVGVAGMLARGAIFVVVGAFLVDAAVTFDPGKARGLDGALRSLAREPAGPWLLGLVAAGLAVFGCFSALEVRYART